MTTPLPAGGGPLLPHPGVTPPQPPYPYSQPYPHQHPLTSATRAWPLSIGNPLWPALLLALVTHAVLLYALGFKATRPLPGALPALDVLVLRQADEAAVAPERPNALADRDQEADGVEEGNDAGSPASESPAAQAQDRTDAASADLVPMPVDPSPTLTDGAYAESIRETSSAPAPETSTVPALETSTAATPQLAAEVTATLTSHRPHPPEPLPAAPPQPATLSADATTAPSSDPASAPAPAPAPTADPLAALASPAVPAPPLSAATILASRGEEIARLNAKLVEDTAAFASRPRRKAISASTQEYKYASYLEAWRRKVEAIGNLNYPEEARRRKLYGNLILQVGVRADGSLEEIRVLRSSGSTILDEAAVRIVQLAAPFAPFPPDIRRETDFLDITRTWQFLSNDRFGQKQ